MSKRNKKNRCQLLFHSYKYNLSANPLDGSWHHIAVVWKLLDIKGELYVDGTFMWEFTDYYWSPQFLSGYLFIGQSLHDQSAWSGTGSFIGLITSFNMWNYQLSKIEIASQGCETQGNMFQWHEIIARENLFGEVKLLHPSSCMWFCFHFFMNCHQPKPKVIEFSTFNLVLATCMPGTAVNSL